nr:small subunit ribosomal protein S8 [uncultured archaeon]
MSQDIIADALNQIMNAKKAREEEVKIRKHSKFLINILDLMKRMGYLEYKKEGSELVINIKEINECKAIKPRLNVSASQIDRYVRRFLPSRDFGYLIISTSQGLLTHKETVEKRIGGSLIAYIF